MLTYFSYFVSVSPWKYAWPFVWKKNGIAFTQGWIVPSLVEISTVVLKKFKDRRMDGQTDDIRQAIRKAQRR